MAERTITVCGTGELYFGDSDQLSQALTVDGEVTLPADRNVRINIVCTNDLDSIKSYSVPVVKADKLASAVFTPVFNGGHGTSVEVCNASLCAFRSRIWTIDPQGNVHYNKMIDNQK